MRGALLKGNLDLLLLSILADGPAHGYSVLAELRERSNGAFDLPEGTVYPALHRLEAAGLLHSRWSREAGRRRRVYSLTRRGSRELDRRKAEWQRFSTSVAMVVA